VVKGQLGEIAPLRMGGMSYEIVFADALLFFILFASSMTPRTIFASGIVMLLISEFVTPKDELLVRRNFYGVIKVVESPVEIKDHIYPGRYLYHGTTTHGLQIIDKKYETTPTAYFSRSGPAGDVFTLYAPKKIGVIGLGAGTMNCLGTPKSEFTFFEIDPSVIDVASDPKYFTFLSACKDAKPPQVILGDGRLEMAKQQDKYDLIALDAFSSDTIPAHLLTMDAIRTYLDHLNPRGVLLFNLSNRYFNLGDALARNATELGLKYAIRLDWKDFDDRPTASASFWFVMARPGTSLSPLLDLYGDPESQWMTLPPPPDLRAWTDDYTNLLSVFEVFRKPVKNAGK
jgi:spermidine synthase